MTKRYPAAEQISAGDPVFIDETGKLQIAAPKCEWICLPYKDKRRGGIWKCKACAAWGSGRKQPKCACKDIYLPKVVDLARRRNEINAQQRRTSY